MLENPHFYHQHVKAFSSLLDNLRQKHLEAYKMISLYEMEAYMQSNLTEKAEQRIKELLQHSLSPKITLRLGRLFKQCVESRTDLASLRDFLATVKWGAVSETYALSLIFASHLKQFAVFIDCMPPVDASFWAKIVNLVTSSNNPIFQKDFLDYLTLQNQKVLAHSDIQLDPLIECVFKHAHVQSLVNLYLSHKIYRSCATDTSALAMTHLLERSFELFASCRHFKPQPELFAEILLRLNEIRILNPSVWDVHQVKLMIGYINFCIKFRAYPSFCHAWDYLRELLELALTRKSQSKKANLDENIFLSLPIKLMKILKSAERKHLNGSQLLKIGYSIESYVRHLHAEWKSKTRLDYVTNHPLLDKKHSQSLKKNLDKLLSHEILTKNDPEYILAYAYLHLAEARLSDLHLSMLVAQYSRSLHHPKVKQRLLCVLLNQQNIKPSHIHQLIKTIQALPPAETTVLEFIAIGKLIIHLKKSASIEEIRKYQIPLKKFSECFLTKVSMHVSAGSNCFSVLCIYQKLIKRYYQWGFYRKNPYQLLEIFNRIYLVCERIELKPTEGSGSLLNYSICMSLQTLPTNLPLDFFIKLDLILTNEVAKIANMKEDEDQRFLIFILKKFSERKDFRAHLPQFIKSLSSFETHESFAALFAQQLESVSAIIKMDISDLLLVQADLDFQLFQLFSSKFANPTVHRILNSGLKKEI